MTCPKCNKEIPYDHNLCGYCGNPIREKCSECGEMEKIGRAVCETKVKDALDKKRGFKEESMGRWSFWFPCLLILMATVIAFGSIAIADGLEFEFSTLAVFPIILGIAIILSLLIVGPLMIINNKKEKETERLFQEKFPEYAEIIKKAEGDKK